MRKKSERFCLERLCGFRTMRRILTPLGDLHIMSYFVDFGASLTPSGVMLHTLVLRFYEEGMNTPPFNVQNHCTVELLQKAISYEHKSAMQSQMIRPTLITKSDIGHLPQSRFFSDHSPLIQTICSTSLKSQTSSSADGNQRRSRVLADFMGPCLS